MPRRFVTLDVFTDTALTGNPLAVVLDAEDLDTAAMQALAAEFNLSETVFVLPPETPRHRARMRVFTPASELPFAGHPTLGTAILLALRDQRAGLADAMAFGLEATLGTLACVVEPGDGRGTGRFKMPVLPEYLGEAPEADAVAAALGLEPGEIGFTRHVPSRHRAGPAFLFVPLASRAALDRARVVSSALDALGTPAALYCYTLDPEEVGHRYQARMFAPHLGVPEDPATGSAAAAFAGVMMQFEPLGDGEHDIVLRQGIAMSRPSTIGIQLVIEAGALRSVEISGAAVLVSEGTLLV